MLPDISSLELGQLHWEYSFFVPLCAAIFGLCVGSYLNVVIYRLPRGLSTNKPKHSFCPRCEKAIPWHNNIPVLSWLLLRARSACCKQPISWQYPLVELATGGLFFLLSWLMPDMGLLPLIALCLWGAAAMVIFVMDWQQMIVLPRVTVFAALAGALCVTLSPLHFIESDSWLDGLLFSLYGGGVGFLLLSSIALLGKWLLGRKTVRLEKPEAWSLRANEQGDDIILTIAQEESSLSSLLMESKDRLHIRGVKMKLRLGKKTEQYQGDISTDGEHLYLHRQNGLQKISLEEYQELHGSCTAYSISRAVMGSGDAWIAMAVGVLCGVTGLLFLLLAASLIGLIAALVLRLGRGQALAFGPCLILACLLWLLVGQQCVNAYFAWVQALGLTTAA